MISTRLALDGLPEGWFTPEDARFYYWFANTVAAGAIMVEVGSYLGRSAAIAAPVCRDRGVQFICVDTWAGTIGDVTSAEALKISLLETFRANMAALGLFPTVEMIQCDSVRAAEMFADKSLARVFIDADHAYEAVRQDIEAWTSKILSRGIIAGHDYYNNADDAPHCQGVKRAVDEAFGKPDGVIGACWWKQLP